MENALSKFAPLFAPNDYTPDEQRLLTPFFTNLNQSVYVPLIFAPELIGALCSRTSRAAEDLRMIYLREFIEPFLNPVREEKDTEESWQEKTRYGKALGEFIDFLHAHPILELFANPRARSFYVKWLAQYGDDSIAQMAGAHLVYTGLSQVAIKHIEDQRIGLAPIEKSTRYVNFAQKINGHFLYYIDPTLEDLGMRDEYEHAMDNLFDAYARLIPKLSAWLARRFPEEKKSVVEKKAFDTLRGLLPTSTLSLVSFFGNGQAFEYMITRCARHPLGEIRWTGERAYEELNRITPAFLRRIKDKEKSAIVEEYQTYLAKRHHRMRPFIETQVDGATDDFSTDAEQTRVRLIEYDPDGETKVITGMLYGAPNNHSSWGQTLEAVRRMDAEKRREIIAAYFQNRTQRWQKAGRALENAYVRFEIVMNIGAWRDLHRHRMQTQQRQHFSCRHGYDVPSEVSEAGLEPEFRSATERVEPLFAKIERRDPDLAQYAVTLAHRIRFMQWQNLRSFFWEAELRTIPEGHPDYRHVEQEKFRLIQNAYPLLAEYVRVNMGEYDFARRGQEERIQKKLAQLHSRE